MAVLEDLLELIPDNEEGLIGADDLRSIVAALYNQPKLSFFTRWGYHAVANVSPPAQGISFETLNLAAATWARFSVTSKDGWDMDGALLRMQVGARIHFQDTNDDTRWMRAEVDGIPTAVASSPPSAQVPITMLGSNLTTGFTGDMMVVFGVVPVA